MDSLSSPTAANRALSTAIDTSLTLYPTPNALHPALLPRAASLVFIDSGVKDGQFLAANVTAGTEVHFLDPTQDAIAQITNTLMGRRGIESVQIVSHGEAGGLDFANSALNLGNLQRYTTQLQSWKGALTEDADILLYGCNVAQGELGKAFTQIMGQLTGADIAASENVTGKGGDWKLEFQTGTIEAASAFDAGALKSYDSSLAAFTPGDLVVTRVGTGSAALGAGIATAVFLDEYTPAGTLVQSVALPTAAIGSNARFTLSGSASSEGGLSLSSNGQFLTIGGYDAATGTPINNSDSALINRVVARIGVDGTIDTSTRISDGYSGNSGNIRSAVTIDGTGFWTGGSGTGGGTRYVTFGNPSTGASTLISASTSNTRVINIFANQLYTSSSSGGFLLATVGTGTSTTAGQTTTNLPGFPTSGSPYGFFFADLDGTPGVDTVYVADSGAGAIQKYSLSGGTWAARGTITALGIVGLAGSVSGNTVTLYGSSPTALFSASDATGYNVNAFGSATSIASAGANTLFRGVAYLPTSVANLAPTVALPSTPIAYTENAAATLLDAGATVADSDSPDFAGGALTVRFSAGGAAGDRLTIQPNANVTLDGKRVLVGGTQIGTYTGGIGTDNLVISLNAAANAANVQALLRAIAYSSTDEGLSTTATSRTVEVTLADGDGGTSTAVTKTVTVTGVNDAPIIGDRRVLYNGSLNTNPAAQGWVAVTTGSVETTSGGATTLNSGASLNLYAGYTRTSPIALDATQGYVLSFQAQVLTETLNSTVGSGADKNGDGKPDRAGFSVLAVSSDNTRAIELGFTKTALGLRIWAQEDGTSQSTPSAQAGSAGDTNLLFTQAEGVDITDPALGTYDLAIKGNTYTLFLNGTAILSGKLRNYTAATGAIDPYETPNLIFFGDDTTSASGSFRLASVGVTVAGNIPDQTILEDAPATAISFGALDLESYTLSPSVSITPGFTTSATLGGSGVARTLSVTPAANAFGTAAIQLNGSDGALTSNDNFNLIILPVNDKPDTTPGADQTVISGVGAQTVTGWTTFTPGPANEAGQTATYTIVSNDNPGLFIVGPAIDANGNLTYTPAAGVRTPQTATITYRVQDSGGTTNGGVDLSDVRSFAITINPQTVSLTALDGTAAELGTDTGTFRISRGTVTNGDLIVNLTIASTSTTSVSDYTFSNNVSVSGTTLKVTIPDGSTSVDVVLTPVFDALVEGTEALTLDLAAGGYSIASAQATATVAITDAPVLSITALDATATELPGNPGTFRITRSGDPSQDLVVNYTVDGTATSGTDYTALTGTTTIAAGQSFVDVTLTPTNDNAVEGTETVVLSLATGNYAISATNTATVNIADAPVLSVIASDATATELPGNPGTFRITRSGDPSQDLVVNYSMTGTATSGTDYTALAGTVTLTEGQSFVDVVLTPINDTTIEGTETAVLNLSAGGYNVDTAQASASIDILDAPVVTLTAPDTIATELPGNSGTYRITRTTTSGDLAVNLTIAKSSTASVTDYTFSNNVSVSGSNLSVTIPDGQDFVEITLTPVNDSIDEGNEALTLDLASGAYNLSPDQASATVNITDAPIVTVSVLDASASESTPNSGSFRLTRTGDTTQALTVNYTIGGTATNGTDYANLTGTATIAAGQSFADVIVNPIDDTITELDETIQLSLATGNYNVGSTASGEVTILANDPTIRITPVKTSQAEGNAGTSSYAFTVELSNTSDEVVTVDYATVDGTATTGDNDYTAAVGTLTFNPGDPLTQTINVDVVGDTKYETNQTFTVNLNNATKGAIVPANASATGTILNDDGRPTITINNVSQAEGNSGTTAYTFTVELSQASDEVVIVNYATANGTATTADSDYIAKSGTLTFNPGDPLTQTMTVDVTGDTKYEADQTFAVNLTATNGTVSTTNGRGIGTILNDDQRPSVRIVPVNTTQTEGNTGSSNYAFTVELSQASDEIVTVNYATADGTAQTTDNDYVAKSGTLTFNPGGPLSQIVTVSITGDTKYEADQTFAVGLRSVSNGTISTTEGNAIGTILNDDLRPTIQITPSSRQNEGNSGTTNHTFTVSLSNASEEIVTVDYATADGTATTADNDYIAKTGTLTFNPGITNQTITIAANGDTKFEADQTFTVNLGAASNGTVSPTENAATATIVNDDSRPFVYITPVSSKQLEGNSGTSSYNFTVGLSNASDEAVTVNYSTADGSATAGSDYVAVGATPLIFTPGDPLTQTISVVVNGDSAVELDETFTVSLSGVKNGGVSLINGTATGTIANDDGEAIYNFGNARYVTQEGDTTTTSRVVTIARSSNVSVASTIDVVMTAGTATAGSDFVSRTTRVTFAAGQTVATVPIEILGDTRAEADETLTLSLVNPSNSGKLGTQSQTILTIANDDTVPVYNFSTPSLRVLEGEGLSTVPLAITRSGNLTRASSVLVMLNNGSAIAGRDFVGGVFTISFAAGEAIAYVPIQVIGNRQVESDKSLTMSFVGFSEEGSYGNQRQASLTIVNDDANNAPIFRKDKGRSGLKVKKIKKLKQHKPKKRK